LRPAKSIVLIGCWQNVCTESLLLISYCAMLIPLDWHISNVSRVTCHHLCTIVHW